MAYIPDNSAPSALATRTSIAEVAVALVDLGHDRGELSGEGLAGLGLHRDDGGQPELQPASLELRHAGLELQLANVRHHDHRQIARNRAGIVVALDDEAGDRRVDGRVPLHFLDATQRGLGLRQVRLREVALGHGRAVRGLRRIETLTGQRPAFEQVLGAIVFGHGIRQRGLRAFDRRVRHRDGGNRGVYLRVDFARDRWSRPPGRR